MATVSLKQFVDQLATSGLVAADDLRAFTESLPADRKPVDAEALAKQLIAAKKLTPFQAQQIWKGKAKHLVLGNYVISDKIGQGGMGMVFKASHKLMKREVALKVLSPAVIKDENAVKRFLREVQAAAKLTHPNIVAAHDADQSSGTYYLIMEYVEGRDLSVIVKKQGPAKIEQAVDCILQAARGLQYAHQQGVIHRDIKPANLLLDKSGTVKVLDMGLARIEDDSVDAATQAGLTGTGTIMGTIDYMSPEQAEDTKRAGPQADIYSLGATLYYLLTGKPIIKGDTLGKKLKVLMTGVGMPDSISSVRSGVAAELDAIFRKMTAFDMKDRYQSMTEVIAGLEALKAGSAPNTTTTPGIQPLAAVRSNDSAMQSFLNHLDDGTAVADRTVRAPAKTTAVAPSETMASSVGDVTNPGFQKTTAFTAALAEPKNRKLVIGGTAAACLLLGAIVWGLSGDGEDPPSDNNINQAKTQQPASKPPPLAVSPFDQKGDHALSFDGKDDFVEISSLKYDGSHPLTIEATVICRRIVENTGGVAAIFGNGSRSLISYTNSDVKIWAAQQIAASGELRNSQTIQNSVVFGRKVHLAAVFDGPQPKLYIDGKLSDGSWFGKAPKDVLLSGMFLGWSPTGTANREEDFLDGQIDEVRISNIARYTKNFTPVTRFTPDKHTLALYHFDSGSGDVLTDSSGNGHNGKIHGATWVRVVGGRSYTPTEILTSPDWEWTKPVNLGPVVNSAAYDAEGTLSPDGLTFLFTSRRVGGSTTNNFDIWQCTRKHLNGPWSKPVCIGPDLRVGVAEANSSPIFSADGKTLYFTSYVSFDSGASDIWKCTRTSPGVAWSKAVKLKPPVNSPGNELHPHISADGKTLLFNSQRVKRGGRHQLWMSTRKDSKAAWSEPVQPKLGLPASLVAFTPYLSQDGLTMLFTARLGAARSEETDLWMATRRSPSGPFSAAKKLGSVINGPSSEGSPVLSADGTTLLFTSDRPDGQGGLDIWMSRRVFKHGVKTGVRRAPNANTALSFDGKDDYVEIPTLKYDFAKPFTVEVFIKPRDGKPAERGETPNFDPVFTSEYTIPDTVPWYGMIYDRPRPSMWTSLVTRGAKFAHQALFRKNLAGERHCVASVWDGQSLRLYLNGRLMTSGRPLTPTKRSDRKASTHPATIGRAFADFVNENGEYRHFFGLINEIRVSKIARYTADYSKDFTPEKRFATDKDTLALYHFDSGSGDVLKDSTGNKHDGKIHGATWVNADGTPIGPE